MMRCAECYIEKAGGKTNIVKDAIIIYKGFSFCEEHFIIFRAQVLKQNENDEKEINDMIKKYREQMEKFDKEIGENRKEHEERMKKIKEEAEHD